MGIVYKFCAKTSDSVTREGTVEAPSRSDAIAKLQAQGLHIISLEADNNQPNPSIKYEGRASKSNAALVLPILLVILLCFVIGYAYRSNAKVKVQEIFQETENKKVSYREEYDFLREAIKTDEIIALSILDGTSRAWSSGINDGAEIGMYLAEVKIKTWMDTIKDQLDDLQTRHHELESKMQGMTMPPSQYKKAYDELEELYAIYSQLYSLALNPTGSLVSFNQKINDLSSEFTKQESIVAINEPK